VWEICEADLLPISMGAGILGTGGGGSPYLGYLRTRQTLRAGGVVRVMDPTEIKDDDSLVVVGGMGSPVISYEKIAQGDEETTAVRALEECLGRSFDAIAPFEMGGGNSMVPMIVSANLGIPLVDGDGMGRAFPELQMITYLMYGGSPEPSALADERGNQLLLSHVVDAKWLERIARAVTIEMGGHAGIATAAMKGSFCKRSIIPNTLQLARSIGDAVLNAREAKSDPSAAIIDIAGGTRYLRGKVTDVHRRAAQGFAKGYVVLDGVDDDAGRSIRIEFQNENLVIWEDDEPKASVPDLISLVTTDIGEPITTELISYGFRADVLVLPCPDLLKTDRALAVVGPRAFGFDFDFAPIV